MDSWILVEIEELTDQCSKLRAPPRDIGLIRIPALIFFRVVLAMVLAPPVE
eukprot:COSAG06_NODE_6967_length_2693_cov_1.263685_2_plen_51_part_00